MAQSMKSRSQSCITPVFNKPSTNRGEDRRSVASLKCARQLEIEDTGQRIALMEATMADFDKTANELKEWIRVEQNRTRMDDPAHFAYSTSAASMTRRRDALLRSRETLIRAIEELKRQLDDEAHAASDQFDD
jgi:flagellar FliJ protein